MRNYSISEISKKFNLTPYTLRFYEKKRDKNNRRYFTEYDLGFLEVINCLKKSGIHLKDIKYFIKLCMLGNNTLKNRYDFVVEQEVELETKTKDLEESLEFLRWKKWYYKTACEYGTESVFYSKNSQTLNPIWYAEYLKNK